MTASQPFTISTWKWLLGLSVFFLALLVSVPSFAAIKVYLGNPKSGGTASGITAISGWAYSTEGVAVTVKMRLNGETREEIPCCGPRPDVQAHPAHPNAPLETGYGLLFNYANLPAGVHTIGVEVSANGEDPVVVDHAVTVVVPADSEFLSAVDLDAASASIERDKIVVSGIEVTDKASGMTATVDIDLNYQTGLQSFQISSAQEPGDPTASFDASQILADVAAAIFDTYDALHMASECPDPSQRQASVDTLCAAVYSLVGTSAASEADAIALLPAVQHAWRDARVPWEQSEAFLFGPVDTDEHDPFLDTWPLNVTDLEAIIASSADIATVELADDVQGFHALEYLLFQDMNGNTDPAAIVNALHTDERRRAYARRVVEEFVSHTQALRDSWDPEGGNYVHELALAGRGSTDYTDQRSAMQTLVESMVGIAAELAGAKIGDPLAAGSNEEEESRYSNNSRIDFLNNVRSINNVYEGRFDQTDSTSMGVTDFVADQDSALDAEVRMAIRDAMAAIIAIPEPFGQSITDYPDAVQKAVDAATHLETTLQRIIDEVIAAASFAH